MAEAKIYEDLYRVLLPTVTKVEALRKEREEHLKRQEMREVYKINQTFLEWCYEATQEVLTLLNEVIRTGSKREREIAGLLKDEFFNGFHVVFNESSPAFLCSWITDLAQDFEGNVSLKLETPGK